MESKQLTTPEQTLIGRLWVPLVLSGLIVVAVIIRLDGLILRGGLASDQIEWANANYYGGITAYYLQMRDAILDANWAQIGISYPPGYATFLALLSILGIEDLRLIRVVQACLDAAALIPLFYVARSLTNSAMLALGAAGVYALGVWWASGSTYILAESLLPALVIVVLAALVWVRGRADVWWCWVILGLVAVILPFFRSSMILLVAPLVVWAFLVAPPTARLRSMAVVATVFLLPLAAWVLRNYIYADGLYFTPPVKWYALWSGLGQVPNDFGYVVSDANAAEMLSAQGIGWHTAAAEEYFKDSYLHALYNNPWHVLKTILYRLYLILLRPDIHFSSWMGRFLYAPIFLATPIAIAGLIFQRRWSDVLLVAGPIIYAMGTLGIMYVELRYVRYASLTYALAAPVAVALAVQGAARLVNGQWSSALRRFGQNLVGGLVLLVLAIEAVLLLSSLHDQARTAAFQAAFDERDLPENGFIATREVRLDEIFGNTTTAQTQQGLQILSDTPGYAYLGVSDLDLKQRDLYRISYTVETISAGVSVGLLSGNQWIRQELIGGGSEQTVSGTMSTELAPGAHLVISAHNPDAAPINVIFHQLSISSACFDYTINPINPIGRLIFRDGIQIEYNESCNSD